MTEPLLEVEGVSVVYGKAQAVADVSLNVAPGEAVAILGANGAGKSSLGRAICGLTPVAAGRVRFAGLDITGAGATRTSRLGLAYLPEGRGIFRGLSVHDNLRVMLRPVGRAKLGDAIEEAYTLFPKLADRRTQVAGTLSGGEQQMLALARILATRPKLVIADEPSLGLAPKIIEQIFEALGQARAAGTAVLLIEQYVHRALAFCDTANLLRRGTVVWNGASSALGHDVLTHYLGQEELATA
jgi:branched-chain amino acid transport system ATP-binding protein